MNHDIGTQLHREGAYDRGYFAHCTCGWAGPLRDLNRRGQALIDGYDHQQTEKESAA